MDRILIVVPLHLMAVLLHQYLHTATTVYFPIEGVPSKELVVERPKYTLAHHVRITVAGTAFGWNTACRFSATNIRNLFKGPFTIARSQQLLIARALLQCEDLLLS